MRQEAAQETLDGKVYAAPKMDVRGMWEAGETKRQPKSRESQGGWTV